MNNEHLSDAEKRLFQGLSREKMPPKHLEKKVIARLIEEDQIQKTVKMTTYLKWAASVAAAIFLFFVGLYFGKASITDMVEIEPGRGYILLLHEDHRFQPGDPMDMFEAYKTWMENTFSRGVKITGQELKNEAVLVDPDGKTLTLGGEVEKRTTGYFLLEAPSLEEAVQVAKENPHIKYGGSIEVKPYMVR